MFHVQKPLMSRSKYLEKFAAEFAAVPFVAECVFPNPHYLKKGLQKEACDLLIALRERGIAVQMKNLDDPEARSPEKRPSWIQKQAVAAVSQLSGAIRTLTREPIWCMHPRRGRVDIPAGSIQVSHGLVLVECGGTQTDLQLGLPLDVQGIPVTYLDTNDFLNLVQQLRSLPDLVRYLDARAQLGKDTRHSIGGEQAILEHYLLQGESFRGWTSYATAVAASVNERDVRRAAFTEKQRRDLPGTLVEYVADQLATRLPNYTEGLSPDTIELYDADATRRRYLDMQATLCDLSLVGRRQLGSAMMQIFPQPGTPPKVDFMYRAVWLDEKPGFLFTVISSNGVPHDEVIKRSQACLIGGLAHFEMTAGMAIVDRDGVSFDVLSIAAYKTTAEARTAGNQLYGDLRIDDSEDRII
jgi:hypothetical protein